MLPEPLLDAPMTPTRLLLAAALLCASSARADTIYLTDGQTLDEVTIQDQTLTGVIYRAKGKSTDTTLEPEKVLGVEYQRLPRLLDQAEAAVQEGSLNEAIEDFKSFVEGIQDGSNTKDRQKWAPAYALQRVIELQMTLGNLPGVIAAADALIRSAPQSFHVPRAYLTKADAQRWLGKEAEALATLEAFKALIDEQRLSEGWRLEADLAVLLSDKKLSGSAKRSRLADTISAAGKDYPTVKNRALVAEGESYLEESKPDFAKALAAFRNIVADPSSDDATLAGAYTGIGDCLYLQAAAALQKKSLDEQMAKDLREALKSYLRVVLVYKDQSRYVQKALFFSGRVFDLFGSDAERQSARSMYQRLVRDYPASSWASDAKVFL